MVERFVLQLWTLSHIRPPRRSFGGSDKAVNFFFLNLDGGVLLTLGKSVKLTGERHLHRDFFFRSYVAIDHSFLAMEPN